MRSLPASWTDAGVIDPFVVRAAGRNILHVDDVIGPTELMDGINPRASEAVRSGLS